MASSGGDDFVTAVLLAMNPDSHSSSNPALHSQAVAYCERLKANPDSWRLALPQLHHLTSSEGPPQAIFFALQLLQGFVTSPSYPSLPPPDRSSLCTSLLLYLRDVLPLHPPPPFVRSKLASLLVSVFKADYPERWPSFFPDLLSLLPRSPALVDVSLRTLRAIDQEVVVHDWRRTDEEVAHNSIIKDHVRGTEDMALVMDAVFNVLTGLRDKAEHRGLVVQALEVVKEYTGWIDLALVANDRYMTLLYSLITSPSTHTPHRDAALLCVVEVFDKKQDRDKRVELMQQYRVLDMLALLPITRLDAGGANAMGAVVNCIGRHLIAWVSVQGSGGGGAAGERVAGMMEAVMGLAYTLLESCDYSVINDCELLDTVKAFIRTITSSPTLLPSHTLHARRIFHAIAEAMLYPISFSFDSPGDDEAAFLDYRASLHTTFCNLVPAMPDLCVDLTQHLLTHTVARWRDEDWRRVEGALRLFYDIGEALKGGTVTRVLTEPMVSMIAGVLRSDVSAHSHHQVSLVWLMLVHRYTRFLEAHAEFVPPTLTAFLDTRGLHHPHPRVRSKAAYLLYKLLQTFPDCLRKTLRPHVDSMLQQLQPVVDAGLKGEGIVSAEDSAYLCEVMGVLVSSAVTGDSCAAYVALVFSFFSSHLQAALATSSTWPPPPSPPVSGDGDASSPEELESVGNRLALLFDSFGCVSKPLSKDVGRCNELFDRCFLQVLQLFVMLPAHEAVRAKTVFVVHRMVECQGARMLTQLPVALPALVSYANHSNIHQLLPLVNQVIGAFKAAFAPTLDAHFLPLCSQALRCLDHYAYIDADGGSVSSSAYSTDRQERLLLQQRYFAFLRVVLTDVPQVTTSALNAPGLRKVIDSVMRGWESRDSGCEKTCIQCVVALIKHLHAQGQVQEGAPYHPWLYSEVTAALYQLLFSPHLQLADANAVSTFRELMALQYLLLSLLPPSYGARVGDWLVTQAGWTREQVKDWMGRLQQGDMAKCREMIMAVKEQRAGVGGGGAGRENGGGQHVNGRAGQGVLHPLGNGNAHDAGLFSRSSSSSTSTSHHERSRTAGSR